MSLEETLERVFGLAELRPGQRVVIDAVLEGRPTVAVMPTGAGKSLCYQLPAVLAGGTSVVVSPLIALMKDQVDALTARGVAACAITSALSASEQAARFEDVAAGRIRLLYVAPERLKSPRFEEAIAKVGGVSLLAIDEAHCISEWGHDFRPDYLRLGELVARWKPQRLLAVTATATPEVRRDIVKRLGMEDPLVLVRGFDRPNLRFRVEQIQGSPAKVKRLVELIAARSGPALVYAATRKNAEAYAAALGDKRVRARAYHAGLDDDDRTKVQDEFMSGRVDVVVATNAFGMGVDKADVRLVVHADLPRSPEAYYQEAGRAGRDGAPADCVLLFGHGDVRLQEFLIDASAPSLEALRAVWKAIRDDPWLGGDEKALRKALAGTIKNDGQIAGALKLLFRAGWLRDRDGNVEAIKPGEDPSGPPPVKLDSEALAARAALERAKLHAMRSYAMTAQCRRRVLLEYFGDPDAARPDGCGGCDVCTGERRRLDDREQREAFAALRLVDKLRGRFGRLKIAGILSAAAEEDERFGEFDERGAIRSKDRALDVLRALEGAGLILTSPGEYPTMHISDEGKRRLRAGGELELALAPPRQGRVRQRDRVVAADAPPAGPVDEDAVRRLRDFRQSEAKREAIPAYMVLSNKVIDEIARVMPRDLDSLARVSGIGSQKLEKYGATILAVVRGAL